MKLSKRNKYKIRVGEKHLKMIINHDDAIYWSNRLRKLNLKPVIEIVE